MAQFAETQAPRVRGYLKEKLHVRAAEVVGVEELFEDAHRQGDAVQDLFYFTLQALQHLVWAQVGSSLDRGKDRHPKTSPEEPPSRIPAQWVLEED